MSGERESIFAAIASRLALARPDAEVEREPSGDPTHFPAFGVIDGGHAPTEFEACTTRYRLTVTIEGYVEGSGGAAAHAAMNALYDDAKAALIAEPPLGGLVESIDEGAMRVTSAPLASRRRIGFEFDLDIIFSTDRAI